jgi:hypothetical protein
MLGFLRHLLIAAPATLSLGALAQAADRPVSRPVAEIGRITPEARQGMVFPFHSRPASLPVQVGLLLYWRDVVEMAGPACQGTIEILFSRQVMGAPPIKVGPGRCRYEVTQEPAPAPALWERLLRRFGNSMRGPPPSPATVTVTQGQPRSELLEALVGQRRGAALGILNGIAAGAVPNLEHGSGHADPNPSLGQPTVGMQGTPIGTAHLDVGALVPLVARVGWLHEMGEQALVHGTRSLWIAWSASPAAPGPYRVSVEQGGQILGASTSDQRLDVEVTLDAPVREGFPGYVLIQAGETIASISFLGVPEGAEPAPRELPARLRGRPEADGAWGAWLLLEGPPRWRLQGLARLANGARHGGDYDAARMVRAIASGAAPGPGQAAVNPNLGTRP